MNPVPNPSPDTSLPPQFWQGVEQFNHQEFYDCHDTLEALWMEALEPDRTFYQGVLQLAVALYHLGHGNWRGAVTLVGESLGRLSRYQPDYEGVDVAHLQDQSRALLHQLQQQGAAGVQRVAATRSPFAIKPKA
ncbi:DUF309 domain-containing protein [Prochlorothrix hollandica]|uniref:DUF309 domain-containing protein n=1 Tax=Prochlorothrix hollandica PCC 9006 = CALU 1027 TaxID=317619 RepID=A0A0M2PY30_PROHO|nr:DUF309 domain-containing protein [Prochlorothrix hollandica]KKJ01085.1 hypothetical protein PROH_01390 [Prochlorothrix hollandica PCC 9006 = CALU 1027]